MTAQIRKLGERLRRTAEPAPADLDKLATFRAEHVHAVARVMRDVGRIVDVEPCAYAARLKSTATLMAKLRNEGCGLHTICDIAGLRLVLPHNDLAKQSLICEKMKTFYAECSPRVVDRLANPRAGYRARHLTILLDGYRVEIQVRTELQHAWAQVFERFADLFGRRIRDGEPPESTDPLLIGRAHVSPAEIIDQMFWVSDRIREFEEGRLPQSLEELQNELLPFREALPSYSSTNDLQSINSGSLFHLVSYDRKHGDARWFSGPFELLIEQWRSIEQQTPRREIVLLASSDSKALLRTHARYFTSHPGIRIPAE